MQIQNALITGSFSYNGADLSNITSSNAYSASLSTRVSQIETVYATTGSNSFRATQSITGSLTVTGQIIAQTLNVQQVTSSIVFSSGSNNFGCDLNSRQTFTGSFYQTGSIACFSNTLFGNTINGNSALISGSGTFGTCMSNGDFTIISNSSPFLIKGRQTYDRGFLGLTWDVSPDAGLMLGNSLGFNTNSIPGSTIGTRALTLACNGAATFASSVTATTGTFSGKISSNTGNTIFSNFGGTSIGITAGNYTGISLGYSENTSYTKTAIVQQQIDDAAARGHLHFLVDTANDGGNAVLGDSKMMINGLTGNVGIGYSSPLNKLHIDGSSGIRISDATNSNFRGITFVATPADSAEYSYIKYTPGSGEFRLYANPASFGGFMSFYSNNAEAMRINSSGYLLIGTTTNSGFTGVHRIKGPSATENQDIISIDGGVEYSGLFKAVSGANYNGATTAIIIGRNSSSLRSINAGGTINASGTDYAEYMLKATTDAIAKGDIVGVNSQGKLTNIFEDSVSFVVKSTDPSYVGGDTWGSVDNIGKLSPEATEEEKAEYEAKLETERAKVDRIAFSGQVPCNVTGATVGDYIVPIELENGKIGGQAVSNPTLEQYRISVGKVWKIMEDGRAWIAVKIG